MPAVTIRQVFLTPREDNQADTTWVENIQNDTLAGNALFVFTQANGSDRVSSEADNIGGQNWAEVGQFPAGQSGAAWLATGISAGIRKITGTLNVSDQFVQRLVVAIA